MAINFEECRKKWLRSDEELVSCKEVLAKAETERGALEVKLKHARNQVDVEIRRRQKAEAVYEKLVGATRHTSFNDYIGGSDNSCYQWNTHGCVFVCFFVSVSLLTSCFVDFTGTSGTTDPRAAGVWEQWQQCPPEWGAAISPGIPQCSLPGIPSC